MLLFVSPSNPTGAVYSREQIEEIGRWAAEKGLWVLTDEIYEHLVYGDAEFQSLPVVVPELADKCIVVNGVAKTYAMTGWRVGWVIGPKDVVKAATNLQSHPHLERVQRRPGRRPRRRLRQSDGRRRDARGLRPPPQDHRADAQRDRRRALPEPEASTRTPRSRPSSARRSAASAPRTRFELAALILEEAEVAVVPGEAFGTPGYLRLSYALGDEDLVEGVSRIQKLLAEARD